MAGTEYSEIYTKQMHIRDLQNGIASDRAHLYDALDEDRYQAAERFLKAIREAVADLNALIEG